MADRDAGYKLSGLVEIDDSYIGASKPGKRGRGAEGKSKVVVGVEVGEDDKPGFAAMRQVQSINKTEISKVVEETLEGDVVAKTDGLNVYRTLDSEMISHRPEVVGGGENAVKVLPWVHTMIANLKGNIRGICHGVSHKHLQRYLSEFCYRFNRRFWEDQLFDRLLTACINTNTITFSELRA